MRGFLLRVYGCQYDIVWEDKAANHAKIRSMIEAASVTPNSLVVLPEMFDTGFSLNLSITAEGPDGISQTFLKRLAEEFSIYLLAGITTLSDNGKGLNQALVIDLAGREQCRYTKIHPFRHGGEASDPGDQVVTFACQDFQISPLVCYDLRFPEVFRIAVDRGAEVLIDIANWPAQRWQHWTALLKARAIENQAYVIGVNRVGQDPNLEYFGHSQIIDPLGVPVAKADQHENVIFADLDLNLLRDYRTEYAFLKDVRSDYSRL